MKEVFSNLRSFILANTADAEIINKSLTRLKKLRDDTRSKDIILLNKLNNVVFSIAIAVFKLPNVSEAKKLIRNKKLSKEVYRTTNQLWKRNSEFANILLLFYNFSKLIIETDVGFQLRIRHNDQKMIKECRRINNLLKTSLRLTIENEDLDLTNKIWVIIANTIPSIVRAWLKKDNINQALIVHDNYLEFLDDIKSKKYKNWIFERKIEISLKKGDPYVYNDDLSNAIKIYEEIFERLERSEVKNTNLKITTLERLSHSYYLSGNLQKAIDNVLEITSLINSLPKNKLETKFKKIKYNYYLGGLYTENFGLELAYPFFQIAYNLSEAINEENIPYLDDIRADLYFNYAMCNTVFGRRNEAFLNIMKALEFYRQIDASKRKSRAFTICELISRIILNYFDFFDKEEINEFFNEFENIILNQPADYSPLDYIIALKLYAEITFQLGDFKKGKKIQDSAIATFDNLADDIKESYNAILVKTKLYKSRLKYFIFNQDFSQAENQIEKTISIFAKCIKKPRDYLFLLDLYKIQASIFTMNHKFIQAGYIFSFIVDIAYNLYERFPDVYRITLLNFYNDKGLFHQTVGDHQKSIEELEKALQLLDELKKKYKSEMGKFKLKNQDEIFWPKYNEKLGKVNDNLGLAYKELNNTKKAYEYLNNSFEIRKKLYEFNPTRYGLEYSSTLNNYALLLQEQGKKTDAERMLIDAIDILEDYKRKGSLVVDRQLLVFQTNLALVYYRHEKDVDSLKQYEKSYKMLVKSKNLDHLASIQKAKINWGYEIIKSRNPNIKSKTLEDLDLIETIKEVEMLPVSEKNKIKMEIEHLYKWLLIKEVLELVKEPQLEWNQIDLILRLIATLRSGSNLLTDESDYENSLNAIINDNRLKIKNYNLEEIIFEKIQLIKELNKQQRKFQNQTLIKEMENNSNLILRLNEVNEKGQLALRSLSRVRRAVNDKDLKIITKIKEYLGKNHDTIIYIIESLPNNAIHICLKNNEIIIKITNKKFIYLGLNLENTLIEYSDEEIKTNDIIEKQEEISLEIWNQLPIEIRKQINNSNTIFLSLCEESQNIPFELVGAKDDKIGLSKVVSRIFEFEYSPFSQLVKNNALPYNNKEILIIVDPIDSNYSPLDNALIECLGIEEQLLQSNLKAKMLKKEEASLDIILLEIIKQYKLIHYAGHGDDYGIIISDSKRLNPTILSEFYIWLANKPLIFLNACLVGVTYYKGGGIFEGLIPSLIRRNSGPIISANRKIYDDNSMKFAKDFYTYFLRGLSVGEALLKTRLKNRNNLIWSKYLLFGDPKYKIQKN